MPKRKHQVDPKQTTLSANGKLKKPKKAPKTTSPVYKTARLQDHVNPVAVGTDFRGQTKTQKAKAKASKGQVGTNPAMPKARERSRYGTTTGLGGPAKEQVRGIIERRPLPISDSRQLIVPTRNNVIARQQRNKDNPLPMQELVNTRGGFHSGRVYAL